MGFPGQSSSVPMACATPPLPSDALARLAVDYASDGESGSEGASAFAHLHLTSGDELDEPSDLGSGCLPVDIGYYSDTMDEMEAHHQVTSPSTNLILAPEMHEEPPFEWVNACAEVIKKLHTVDRGIVLRYARNDELGLNPTARARIEAGSKYGHRNHILMEVVHQERFFVKTYVSKVHAEREYHISRRVSMFAPAEVIAAVGIFTYGQDLGSAGVVFHYHNIVPMKNIEDSTYHDEFLYWKPEPRDYIVGFYRLFKLLTDVSPYEMRSVCLHHRDLHSGNIVWDTYARSFAICDFGNSVLEEWSGDRHDPASMLTVMQPAVNAILTNDADDLYTAFRSHLPYEFLQALGFAPSKFVRSMYLSLIERAMRIHGISL